MAESVFLVEASRSWDAAAMKYALRRNKHIADTCCARSEPAGSASGDNQVRQELTNGLPEEKKK